MFALVGKWRRTWRYRTALRELTALSPDELSDLGIPQRQIERLARAAFLASEAEPARDDLYAESDRVVVLLREY